MHKKKDCSCRKKQKNRPDSRPCSPSTQSPAELLQNGFTTHWKKYAHRKYMKRLEIRYPSQFGNAITCQHSPAHSLPYTNRNTRGRQKRRENVSHLRKFFTPRSPPRGKGQKRTLSFN